MRFVTVNLYDGRAVPHDLQRFLDELHPDVLAAQEVGPNAAPVLESWFDHGSIEPALHWRGKALVSKRPIEVATIDLPFRGGYLGRTVLDDGLPLEILSLHLANPVGSVSGVAARRRQIEALGPYLVQPGRRIVAGDLNATPAWPAYRRLREHLDDGVAAWAERTGTRPRRTWAPSPSWPALLRIDHVLTSGVEVTRALTRRIDGLDHRALVVDLEPGLGGARW